MSADAARAGLSALLARRVPTGLLLRLAIGWLSLDAWLLCHFIGLDSPWIAAIWLSLTVALLGLTALPKAKTDPTVAALLCCLLIGFALMMSGGAGRFFYANIDWQVRDAVLRDMRINPWPFVYAPDEILRAPIGMYLVPALVGKALGQSGADLALLVQNGTLTGLALAIASSLFDGPRSRMIGLAVFLAFSGLDIVGQAVVGHLGAVTPTAHLEGWGPTQFSSTMTLAFWVPQHALAGWLAAIAFLLWRLERLTVGILLAMPPLLALWSPLSAIGILPFIAYALWHDGWTRRLRPSDLATPLIATAITLPSLAYLGAAGDRVGMHLYAMRLEPYLIFEAIEILPFLIIAVAGWRARFGGATLAICAAMLILLPWLQIGASSDLAMRGSIPALAILACHLGEALWGGWPASARRKAALITLLAIGGLTGVTEVARAFTYPVSPAPRCDFSSAWDVTFGAFPKDSYLATRDRMPALIRPTSPTSAAASDPRGCFDHPWARPPLF